MLLGLRCRRPQARSSVRLRFLGARDDFPYKIIIATTNICNGNTMIKSLVYEIENKLVRDGTPVSPEVFAGTTGL